MKIRQHKILIRTLHILFIINFVLAAPAAVRERPEIRLDANVRRDVTSAPQKRWDPLDEGGSTNVPKAGYAQPPGAPPPNLDSTDWVQGVSTELSLRPPGEPALRVPVLRPQTLQLLPPSAPPPGLQPPSWAQGARTTLSAPNALPPSAPPPSARPPGSRPLRLLLPRPRPFRPPPPRPRLPRPRPPRRPLRPLLPRPLPFRPPSPPLPPSALPSGLRPQMLDSTDLSQTVRIELNTASAKTLSSPERPGSSTGNVLPSPGPPTGSRLPVESMPMAGSLTSPPPLPHGTQPGPSEDHFPRPPGFSENSDASSSTGNQPSPGVNPETHPVSNLRYLPPDFWNNFLKGKIKPRIFDSDPVPEGPEHSNLDGPYNLTV